MDWVDPEVNTINLKESTMRNRLTVALVAVLGLAFSATANAQTCTTAGCSVTTTASVTIPTLQKLTLSAITHPDQDAAQGR